MTNKYLLFILFLLLSSSGYSLEIPKAKLDFKINDNWKYSGKEKIKKDMVSFTYKRDGITNSKGEIINPGIVIISEKVNIQLHPVQYFTYLRSVFHLTNSHDNIIDSFSGYFNLKNGLGVIGKVLDPQSEREMVYILSGFTYGNYGLTIICSSTADVYSQVKNEFINFLKSLELDTSLKRFEFIRIQQKKAIIALEPESGQGLVVEVQK